MDATINSNLEEIVQGIKQSIILYENQLDENYEVELHFPNYGTDVVLDLLQITYRLPNLIIFEGIIDERFSHIVQTYDHISFLIKSVKNPDSNRCSKRVGKKLN